MLPKLSSISRAELISYISGEGPQAKNFRLAIIIAVLLHLVLLLLLPDLPEFKISNIRHEYGINVFLNKAEEKQTFEQTLNQLLPQPIAEQAVLEESFGAASVALGDQSLVTEESPKVESESSISTDSEASGGESVETIQRTILFSRSAIQRFAQQEAIRYTDSNADELKRFSYTFNSYRNYRRRNRTESYKNRYGDYYVRDSKSSGDVCFVQERELNTDELSTKTVYFFRCDSEPIKLNIPPKGQG